MQTNLYFYRNIIISKIGKQVSLVDIYNPTREKKSTEVFDEWMGMILLLADGQHTIDQLTQFLSTKYTGAPPSNLAQTIESVVARLVESKFIILTKKPVELPYYLSAPYEALDIEKAKKSLEEDRTQVN